MTHQPASHRAESHRLGRLPSGRTVAATLHRYVGGDGPTVYVQAAQHGIELNGPAALRRLHGRLVDAAIAGEVRVVPVANPLAFDHRSYTTPAAYDARSLNMNRAWPGDASGSLGERLVARLWALAREADAAVDLHTGTPAMLQHVRCADDDGARSLARAFGTEYRLVDAPDDAGGRFRATAHEAGIPTVTAELANSRTVSRPAAAAGVDGIERVLRSLGVLSGSVDPADQSELRDSPDPVTAADSGLFEPEPGVTVGEPLDDGDRVGTVYDPASFEPVAEPTAPDGGVVYSLTQGTVVAGERLAALGARA